MITILRLGHRKERDARASMHVALVARALGAKKIIFCGERDDALLERVRSVVKKWGGNFKAEYAESYRRVLRAFRGKRVHLTMYGEPFEEKMRELRGKNLLAVAGSEKVPGDVYALCDYNLSVTNQPHSEIGALALFLHEFFEGRELKKYFPRAMLCITPSQNGKRVKKQSINKRKTE